MIFRGGANAVVDKATEKVFLIKAHHICGRARRSAAMSRDVVPKSGIITRPWTSGDENRLGEMLDDGKSAGEIAAALDRTRGAIYSKMQSYYRKQLILDFTRAVRSRVR
jgi:hypothetical protein